MDREEVLSLLRTRVSDPEVVELVSRRFPDIQPPLELVPQAIALACERGDEAARLAERIPHLTEECRTVLRHRLQGRSFEEITEETEIEAVAVYSRCRKRLYSGTEALPEYATGLLDPEDRLRLFARALRDQATFDSLRDEHTLLTLMEDPASRAQLLESTDKVQFTIGGGIREWFDRPRSKVMLGLGVAAGLAILLQECGK